MSEEEEGIKEEISASPTLAVNPSDVIVLKFADKRTVPGQCIHCDPVLIRFAHLGLSTRKPEISLQHILERTRNLVMVSLSLVKV